MAIALVVMEEAMYAGTVGSRSADSVVSVTAGGSRKGSCIVSVGIACDKVTWSEVCRWSSPAAAKLCTG